MKFEYSINETIGYITLNNPLNDTELTITSADHNELSRFLATPSLKGVLIKGKKTDFYRGDVLSAEKSGAGKTKLSDTVSNQIKNIAGEISCAAVPVTSVIQGACFDLGLVIAFASHFRFVSATAQFRLQHSSFDFSSLLDDTIFSQPPCNNDAVKSAVLSGNIITGSDAKSLGIIDYISSENSIENDARDFLLQLTKKRPPHLIRVIMQSIHNSRLYPKDEALLHEATQFDAIVRNSNKTAGYRK